MTEIKKLKPKILKILANFPQSRNSDMWLTIKLWTVYYPSRIQREKDKAPYIFLKDIMEMPREDAVKRIRAIIQNIEHKFLPTDWKIAKQRKINEADWKRFVNSESANTIIPDQLKMPYKN